MTLNDPIFVEAAEAFADRILREASVDDGARIDYAFTVSLSRAPTKAERLRFLDFVAASRGSDATVDFRRVWTSVATVLLNLDETLVRP